MIASSSARRAFGRSGEAIIRAGSAARIAQSLSTDARPLHASDVHKIWATAKENGDLPKIDRPAGEPQSQFKSQGKPHEAHH
jgi:hypothetical protein